MAQVFISYRQVDDAHRKRVLDFGKRLRDCGVDVVLDQFFLDANPGGPLEGWPKWCSDHAISTERVIIVASEAWFRCFDGREAPGEGLGAACEAADIRQRIYNAAGKNPDIRVVLLDAADVHHISFHFERYHHFHADRDFVGIVRWLGATPVKDTTILTTSTPNNLPRNQSFFGREKELAAIRDALDPESRAWGVLIHGPAGMGKTSLAVHAAYESRSGQFQRIIFVSVKDRELDDDGLRGLGTFILPGLLEVLNELSRELGRADIVKASEDQRIHLLLDALRDARALLILDNLESLTKADRDQIFTFVKRLPQGCKAILTSRRPFGSGSEFLVLDKLDESAALETLGHLAQRNPLLARTCDDERLTLYTQTGGRPLLLRWLAGQIGRGSCRTFIDALQFLRSCPSDNDPLEFVFGDLARQFTLAETRVLGALSHFTILAKVEHIVELSDLEAPLVEIALRTLANRSLVVPGQDETVFTLVPMVAEFLRRAQPEVVAETRSRLVHRAGLLVLENGLKHGHFTILDAAWPIIAAALPLFLALPNSPLQTLCKVLQSFLEFTGRWDEWASFERQAEIKAVAVGDFDQAGQRAKTVCYVSCLRGEAAAVVAWADRATAHWQTSNAGARAQGIVTALRGHGHLLNADYAAAITAYRQSLDLHLTLSAEGTDVAIGLNHLANAEVKVGDFVSAEEHYREALRMGHALGNSEIVAGIPGSLAALALHRKDWPEAETLARESLRLAHEVGRQELIGHDCLCLAMALVQQGKQAEALPYAKRAEDILARLGASGLEQARGIVRDCESASLGPEGPARAGMAES